MKKSEWIAILTITLVLVAYAVYTLLPLLLDGGYAVTNATYTYSATNPSMIVFVDFDITPAASKAGVSLISGSTLTECVLTASGTHAHCLVNISVMDADLLRVVASE